MMVGLSALIGYPFLDWTVDRKMQRVMSGSLVAQSGLYMRFIYQVASINKREI